MYVSKKELKRAATDLCIGMGYGAWLVTGGLITYVGLKVVSATLDSLGKLLTGDSTNEPK